MRESALISLAGPALMASALAAYAPLRPYVITLADERVMARPILAKPARVVGPYYPPNRIGDALALAAAEAKRDRKNARRLAARQA